MADNTAQNATDTLATDDVTTLNGGASSGVKVERVKVGFGDDGTYRDASATYPLPSYPPDITVSGTISATDAVVGVHAGAGVPLTGTPTANSYVAYPIAGGESGFTIRLSGTFGGGTVWIESSPDSTNGVDGAWVTNVMRQSGITNSFVDADITAAGIFRGVVAGYSYVRVRVTGATTPSIAVVMRGSRGPSVTAQVAALPPGANTIGATSKVHTSTQTTATPATVATTTGQVFESRAVIATATSTTLVLAPGAGVSVYVTDVSVSNAGATLSVVTIGPSGLTQASAAQGLDIVAAATGGGGTINLQVPYKLAANTALVAVTSAASTSIYVNVSGYVAA